MRTVRTLACAVLLLIAGADAQGFRGGFKTNIQAEFDASIQAAQKGLPPGMPKEMAMASRADWQIQPMGFDAVKDKALRRHLEKHFSEPITLKLSTRQGKHGMRAVGMTANTGKRLRAYWRQGAERQAATERRSADLLKMTYDEAVRSRLPTIDFELQLPPMQKYSKTLPTVVCSVPMELGTLNKGAIVPRMAAKVSVMPAGRTSGDDAVEPINAGRAHVTVPMRAGLVDPSWARGRKIFRRGRPVGIV